jgi:hypothetical protein
MFDSIIPVSYYTHVYYNFILLVLVLGVIKLSSKPAILQGKKEYKSMVLLIIVLLYMGLRPISGVFTDMVNYNYIFEQFAMGYEIDVNGDILWNSFMKFCSAVMTAKMFFFICALLYVVPLYVASKKWLGANRYYLFLMALASFSFWTYGTNGIRNGVATSLFVLGLSYSNNKKLISFLIFFIALNIHQSILIPLFAFVLTIFFKDPKKYLLGWLLAIPLSLLLGSFWETFFASLGLGGDRVRYLTGGNINNDSFAYTGFRWDFVLYSASAIYAGYYFIVKRKFKDIVYIQLFNVYVTANAFWILVIRANFSNRFAYLSWFLMAFIIFYPFLKWNFIKNQQRVLAYCMIAYFGFTYLMFLIK